MSTIDTVFLGLKLILYGIGLAVVTIAIGTIVDWAGDLLAGDSE